MNMSHCSIFHILHEKLNSIKHVYRMNPRFQLIIYLIQVSVWHLINCKKKAGNPTETYSIYANCI